MKDKNSKIAIIGAGLSGLAAAYFLRQNGYANVTIFEKLNRVGGYCKTTIWNEKPYDMGTVFLPQTHREVRKLCKNLGVKLVRSFQFANERALKTEIEKMEKRFQFKHSKSKLMIELMKWFFFYVKFTLTKKGSGYTHTNYTDLDKPIVQFLKEKKMLQLLPLFYLTMELLGYGHLHEKATLYAIRSMKLENCLNSLFVFLWKRKSLRMAGGWEEFCRRIADGFSIRLNSSITKIDRSHSKVNVYCNGEVDQFDELIWACGLNEARPVFNISEDEKELFSKAKYNQCCATCFSAKGIPKIESTIYHLNVAPEPGGSSLITRYWDDHDIYVAWSYVNDSITNNMVQEQIKKEIEALGGQGSNVEFKEQIVWQFFPHVSSEEIAAGYYDWIESLQGNKNTYFTGNCLAFESAEDVVRYSKELVEKYFP